MSKLAFRVSPGERCCLADIDPRYKADVDGKQDGLEALQAKLERLNKLQEALYAESGQSLLVVLQAMDTAGKDGTIKHAMSSFNPQGVTVSSFKVPTEEELAHDFLWRVHRRIPAKGMIGIFNRSHYEDVLVVRVKKLVPERVWRPRYEHINHFERLLSDSGVTIVKIYLHISPDEQAERLLARQLTRDKQWKFSPGDLADRALWHEYMAAYEEALERTSTKHAPWWVVPADRKWFRNLAVSQILIDALEGMRPQFPAPAENIMDYEIPEVAESD